MKTINCKDYNIHINDWASFGNYISDINPTSVFVLVDENTERYCLYNVMENLASPFTVIRISSGEQNKNLISSQFVWTELMRNGADRHSLLINLGGGVIGDLGGFCAATYMRGINFIQVPTTLLSQVDACIGGKLGIDLMGFKNMVGLIKNPDAVFVFTDFLKTLPAQHIKSGFAELLKHGLIADKEAWLQLTATKSFEAIDYENLVYESLEIKKNVTEQDPNEKGIRKILNFGHTIGHAIETYWMDSRTPLLHGEAIAIGMISEAYISYRVGNISESELFGIRQSILKLYGHHPKFVKPTQEIMKIMTGDKKNYAGEIRFSLLEAIGKATFDITVNDNMIEDSFLFYKEKIKY